MRRSRKALVLALSSLLLSGLSVGPVLAADDDSGWSYDKGLKYRSKVFKLDFDSRLQTRITAEDPELGDSSESFDVSRFKLNLGAVIDQHWKIGLQADVANGSESSSSLLEDAYVVYTKHGLAQIWAGQGKILFGRQDQVSTGNLQFIEGSAITEEFRHNPPDGFDSRDVGVAVLGQNKNKTYNYGVGLYNGNGINKDEKDNSDYMITGQLVVTPFGEYERTETDLSRSKKSRLAVGISVMSVTKGTQAISEKLRDATAGLEFAFRKGGVNLSAEFFTRSADAPLALPDDEIDTDGFYVQGGFLFKSNWEIAGRYGEIIRDVPNDDEIEYGIAGTYYLDGHRRKIQADYRKLEFEGVPTSPDIDAKIFRVQLQLIF